ncbi:MAG: ankyrin repeat domain-containing protein [Lachnospiraceae bacterium]|nr:ankyrin repeat domain-containing protein [Lachnospiraceae bacterium]
MGSVFFLAFVVILCFILGNLILGISQISKGYKIKKYGGNRSIAKKKMISGSIMICIAILSCTFFYVYSYLSTLKDEKMEKEFIVYAARNDDYELVKELLESGVPVDTNDYSLFNGNIVTADNQNTALYEATASRNYKMVELLLEYGANPDQEGVYNQTPLQRTIENDTHIMMEIFLEHGADPNFVTSNGNSYLEYACNYADVRAVQLLLEYGANPNEKNNKGIPLIEVEIKKLETSDDKYEHGRIIELLKEYGAVSD